MSRCRALVSVACAALVVMAVASCGSNQVVLDAMVSLKDGESNAWKLTPGLYRVAMTASGDGAQVEWVGTDCPKSPEGKTYTGVCELRQDGQILVTNPTSFGMGQGTTVTVKVTKLR